MQALKTMIITVTISQKLKKLIEIMENTTAKN